MDVAGNDGLHPRMSCEVTEERVPAGVAALERALQLDVEALRPEGAGKGGGGVRVTYTEALSRAAREADEPLVQLGQESRVERGRQQDPLLRPRVRVCRGQQPAEVRVPLGGLDEQGHVRPAVQGHLGARDRPDADELRRVGELERAVDALVVGERERLVAELRRAQRQLLRVRGAVEERIG